MDTKKSIIGIACQAIVIIAFGLMAAASSSTSSSTSSSGSSSSSSSSRSSLGRKIDWRGAAVGGTAGYYGYVAIGKASSQDEAERLAESKGYTAIIWDSKNGIVYAK